MIPLADVHVHLLAGLDDGPRTQDEAVAMCRSAYLQGVRWMAATAHQNERWPAVTPERIREATVLLREALHAAAVPMEVFPTAEVMAQPDTFQGWCRGNLLTVGDKGNHLLLEMPRGVFVDLRPLATRLHAAGIRPILAHPERERDLLHEPDAIEELIEAGCLVQVSSASVVEPRHRSDLDALKDWFQRGIVHFLGSDGHSLIRRPPRLAPAYQEICRWISRDEADRIAGANGMAVLQGAALRPLKPRPRSRSLWWIPRLW